jgi:hypothetical protein
LASNDPNIVSKLTKAPPLEGGILLGEDEMEIAGNVWNYVKEAVAAYPGAAIIVGVSSVLAVWIF